MLENQRIHFQWTNFVVYAPEFLLEKVNKSDESSGESIRPKRFDPKTKTGFSDHLPVVMDFDID
jgi:hypothetical protein